MRRTRGTVRRAFRCMYHAWTYDLDGLELTEVLPEFADGLAAQYFVGHLAEFGSEIRGFTVDGSDGLDKPPGVSEDQDRRYYAITIKPNVFINLVPGYQRRPGQRLWDVLWAAG